MKYAVFLGFVLTLASACAKPASPAPADESHTPSSGAARRGRASFVGSDACAGCHRAQSEAYRSSHHGKALQTPGTPSADAFPVGQAFTTRLGGTTHFTADGGTPVITTAVGDERSSYAVRYLAGVSPLVQYVLPGERGKLQTLSVAWDARARSEGGQRLFHVYGADGVAPDDPLHFSAASQNWNHMCAECHSTAVERRYDVSTDSFDTRWAEQAVGCEACHGPGAAHVRSARAGEAPPAPLPARLAPAAPWAPSATGSPVPRSQDGAEVEACAPCHSRRAPLREGFLAGEPFLASFAPELLLPGRYHADGQVEGEVYEWGSFIQSRMYQAGVRCSDCHEPHAGATRAEGNALCVRCHEAARFDAPSHTHHAAGARCIDCHMPPSTFMQVDERRDHSIRIPRPDLSVTLGTPNACNGCHAQKSAVWARDQLKAWFPASRARPHFGEALSKDRKGTVDAPHALRALARDGAAPPIARATALERLARYPGPATLRSLRAGLTDADALIAYGAVLGSAQVPPRERTALLLPVLDHPARAVRVEAAKLLAGLPQRELPSAAVPAWTRATDELAQRHAVSASRAESHVEKSAVELARGELAAAEASLQVALRLSPCLPEAQLNLAELARARGDEPGAERAIRAALGCWPNDAAAHHALGLWQVRARQSAEALASLRRAAQLAPNDTRFGYVLAVALHGAGERAEAITLLERMRALRPNDVSTLQALARYLRDAGRMEQADAVLRDLTRVLDD